MDYRLYCKITNYTRLKYKNLARNLNEDCVFPQEPCSQVSDEICHDKF